MSKEIRKIGVSRYRRVNIFDKHTKKFHDIWMNLARDRSDFETNQTIRLESNMENSDRPSGLNFLNDIKHIRRLDFIDGDLSLLWDQFIIKNVKSETPLYYTRTDGILPENITRESLLNRLVQEFNLKLFIKNIDRDEETHKVASEMMLYCSKDIQI